MYFAQVTKKRSKNHDMEKNWGFVTITKLLIQIMKACNINECQFVGKQKSEGMSWDLELRPWLNKHVNMAWNIEQWEQAKKEILQPS